MENLQPKIRFPEFKGDWESEKLGELATNKSGKYNPERESGSVKCIELEHLDSESGQLLGFVDGKNLSSIKNKFDKGDVLFGKLRPYLKKYHQPQFDGVCSSEIWVLKGVKVSNDFLFRIVQSDIFIDLANQSSGSKMPRADWSVVANGVFNFPSLSEQTKIATFLSSVDEKLNLLKEKKTLLEEYKKGMMQKIFPSSSTSRASAGEGGKNIPELRFKPSPIEALEIGNDDYPDWEEKSLGELMTIADKIKPIKIDVKKLLTVKLHLKGVLRNENTESLSIGSTNYFIRKKGQFIYGKQNLFNGAFAIIPEEFDNYLTSGDVPALNILTEKINSRFLYNYFSRKEFYSSLESIASGSGSKRIHEHTLLELKISIPCLAEQTKIANFLSAIDEKIELVAQQIEDTQEYKKGLLQGMFC